MTEKNSVDDYLAALPEKARAMLEKLRKIVKSVVPGATEGISYQIPIFKHEGRPLVGLGSSSRQGGATKGFCSFYVMSPSVVKAHQDDLKPYDTATGTVHFPLDKPIPTALVKKLVKARIAENEATQQTKKKRTGRKKK